ncbi:MAG: hypothetical protein IJA34_11375 [Lachnospiraceae bacterium]|nr:hypothetical protein [Lachnospiraceae bacterium]
MKVKVNRTLKRISTFLLIIIMIAQFFMTTTNVILAADVDNYDESVSEQNDVSISGTDSFGTMLVDELSDEVEEQVKNNGCNIFGVTVEKNTAIVSFETKQDAVLVVSIYTEDGMKMLTSGIIDVMEGEISAFVDIEVKLPKCGIIKSFLIDTTDYSPLCPSYESTYYTDE